MLVGPAALVPRACRAKIMDAASVNKLLCVSRAPLSNAGDVMIQTYKDDSRDFARRSMFCRDVEIMNPPERCKKRVGGGRCRRAVSRGAIVQLCVSHMETVVSDYNLDSLRQFRTLVQEGSDPTWRQIGMRERSRSPPRREKRNDGEAPPPDFPDPEERGGA